MRKIYLFLMFAWIVSIPAYATTIFTPTFTAGFDTAFGANAAAAKAAWTAAANGLGANLSDNIHVNITVDGVAGTGTLGSSSTPIFSISYASLYAAVVSNATSVDDLTAIGVGGSLASGADPVGGAHGWWVTRAQRKALGLLSDDLATDGTVTFGAGFSYTFSGPIAPGTIDFQGVVLHEITEIMGRIGLSGDPAGGSPGYTLLDAFSYTAASTRSLGRGGSFSLNNGTTLLKAFNDQASGDTRDWAAGSNDAFNAFSTSSVANGLTAVDLRTMDAIGFELATSTNPEPSSLILMSGGLLGLFYVQRRRSTSTGR